ncbi:hypothetical protein PP175_05365 [Aneurinibacillus sp. Ricciae_BoGa-3]|uniref:hypothetical protein n=1 Tax=Aneurinibacillus sp. Ricciae_BoGa-3 TaxID=3022697 RepID=UPI0023415471|nr:hypothetical protein [Aneurinibacillus sp. Ricciae_BoGa-3]WCK55381.1 hypothetical protein PP175_05365 [Aneurinibacillus sp. Ricciae_BoGa-3]
METFNLIASACSIASFLMSIFVVSKVIKINSNLSVNSNNKDNRKYKQNTRGQNSPIVNAEGDSNYRVNDK